MDKASALSFQVIRDQWPWRPIRNCPGRFVLPRSEGEISFAQLIGGQLTPRCYQSAMAPDPILVLTLPDGGIISYQKSTGRLLHTLNTREGFLRKLRQLEIPAEVESPPDA